MKKTLVTFLVGLVITLTACGTAATSTGTSTTSVTPVPTSTTNQVEVTPAATTTPKETPEPAATATPEPTATPKPKPTAAPKPAMPAAAAKPASKHFEVTLGPGNYIAGKDIPVGTYNLTAVSGEGNVSSSNMYFGGLNEIMGTSENTTFNGAKLSKNVSLSIAGAVTIKAISDDAKTGEVTARSGANGNAFTLSTGNYTAGQQFPAGNYSITAVSGSGNVSSSNMYSGGLNEIMGTDTTDGMTISSFSNCELPNGTTLELTSGITVKLTPVGQ